MRRNTKFEGVPKKRTTNRRTFEIELTKESESHLSYFIKQELAYHNLLIEQITPRLRAFPGDLLLMKDRERRIWESCAEQAIDPVKLGNSEESWPEPARSLYHQIVGQDGVSRLLPSHLAIMRIAAAPARIHPLVRRSMAAEILKSSISQAEILHAAASSKSDGLRAPVQMMQTHTLDTKRHLQIPGTLARISFREDDGSSLVNVPYSRDAIVIKGVDISDVPFKWLVIRSPHWSDSNGGWYLDLKDSSSYAIGVTDHPPRRHK